ncbi:adenylosuccinate lyase family protein [Haloferula sp. A504]|uniref:adenylosuccinate lyase family protein n=1 Tax=Haloferula sp. A504 TaxID=3373601 RepID=UPI0031C4E5CD|nr:adenylosuccinate lyase family protein [Verrucomicrobiaceae bacterium E54]
MATIIDSPYYGDAFTNAEVREVFSDGQRFTSWLEVEAALARAEALVGLIPESAAEGITAAARFENLEPDAMREHYRRVGFPIVPLVKQLSAACDPEVARFVHWGATTQDIVDTGLVLQMRTALKPIESDLDAIISSLAGLAVEHRDTVMAGRTFQQQAAPITFGFKVAVWLDELLRHRERLPAIKRRALVCQFGGAVGTLATLGDDGLRVLKALSRELDLEEPPISWHTARDGWTELVFWLAMVGTTLRKIAEEVAMLMRTEVSEVREPFEEGRGGSSTMPQKRNPIACPIIIALGKCLKETVSCQMEAMVQDHERAVASQPLEWLTIPDAFVLLSGSLLQSREMLGGLQVDVESMERNLQIGNGLLMAEAVMMGLAPIVGRGEAHEIVTVAASRAIEENLTLKQALLEDEQVSGRLSESELDGLLSPANYLGVAGAMIDRVLSRV